MLSDFCNDHDRADSRVSCQITERCDCTRLRRRAIQEERLRGEVASLETPVWLTPQLPAARQRLQLRKRRALRSFREVQLQEMRSISQGRCNTRRPNPGHECLRLLHDRHGGRPQEPQRPGSNAPGRKAPKLARRLKRQTRYQKAGGKHATAAINASKSRCLPPLSRATRSLTL